MKDIFQVFSGNANRELAQQICDYLDIPLGRAEVQRFPDGETDVKVLEDVRGSNVFLVQPTCPPVNENVVELLIMIDCFKRASAREITAVIPYFGYARQDRKAEGRVPITAKLIANLITVSGANRVLTIDLHSPQIQGFFDIPVDNLYAAPVTIDYIKRLNIPELVIVTPDVGGINLARAYARRLNAELTIVDKRRSGPRQTEVMHVIGDVEGKAAIIVDDIISTGTSAAEAVHTLKRHGARDVYLCATHPVFSPGAVEKLRASGLKEIIVSNTIPADAGGLENLRVLSVANLLGEAIRRIHKSESVSSLFV